MSRRLLHLLLFAVGFAWALPLLWMLLTSLQTEAQALAPEISPWPTAEGLKNYRAVWNAESADFPLYFKNSILVAVLSTLGMTLGSALCAFGLARLEWRGRKLVMGLVLATMMLPFTVLMAPQYLLFQRLGWIGSLLPLWLPAWFGGAFSIFLLHQFASRLPRELDEAAAIDGCGPLDVFWRIALPNLKPALATVALLQFVTSWNDFTAPLMFVNHREQTTVALGLQQLQSQHGGTAWPEVMAASLMATAPVLLLFLAFQHFFVSGSATEGSKG